MGKENKELLKTILANTQLIMKHLKIESGSHMEAKKETKVKAAKKSSPARKNSTKK